MTALGCGIDMVDIPAFVRALTYTEGRLAYVCFSDSERAETSNDSQLASLWALKEATAKALGVGLLQGIAFKDIEFAGIPCDMTVRLHGRARTVAAERGITRWLLSVSHNESTALAAVVACSESKLEGGTYEQTHRPDRRG